MLLRDTLELPAQLDSPPKNAINGRKVTPVPLPALGDSGSWEWHCPAKPGVPCAAGSVSQVTSHRSNAALVQGLVPQTQSEITAPQGHLAWEKLDRD